MSTWQDWPMRIKVELQAYDAVSGLPQRGQYGVLWVDQTQYDAVMCLLSTAHGANAGEVAS